MRKCLRIALTACAVAVVAIPAAAGDDGDDIDPKSLPWDKAYVQLGGFLAGMDSGFRIGSSNVGVGVVLDVEQALGLDETQVAFRLDGAYRFTRNRRHKLDFSWFSMNRSAARTLGPGEEIRIPDPDDPDNDIVITDTTIESKFNFDIYKIKYKYSFLLDQRVDVFVGGGFYVMPMEFGLGEQGADSTDETITAPLPVLSVGVDVALARKWQLRQEFDLMYLRISGFTGTINDFNLGLERSLSKSIALGLGVDSLQVAVQAEGSGDYPGVDFDGTVEFKYVGLQFYVRGRL